MAAAQVAHTVTEKKVTEKVSRKKTLPKVNLLFEKYMKTDYFCMNMIFMFVWQTIACEKK